MKVRLLSLLAGMMMLGSASIAGASELVTLNETQMDAVTAGQGGDTFNFTFNDNSCAACVFNFN